MGQMTMFPEMVPEGDRPPKPTDPVYEIPKTSTWQLVRRGRRADVSWHKIKAPSSEGGVITRCKFVGSLVHNEIANGTTIRACSSCLATRGV